MREGERGSRYLYWHPASEMGTGCACVLPHGCLCVCSLICLDGEACPPVRCVNRETGSLEGAGRITCACHGNVHNNCFKIVCLCVCLCVMTRPSSVHLLSPAKVTQVECRRPETSEETGTASVCVCVPLFCFVFVCANFFVRAHVRMSFLVEICVFAK